MIYRKLLAHWRIILPLTLLVMILLRLVWIQIRQYQVQIEPTSAYALVIDDVIEKHCAESNHLESRKMVARPGERACLYLNAPEDLQHLLTRNNGMASLLSVVFSNNISLANLLKMNQWLLIGNAFLAALLARFLSGSWIVALISSTVILSRGSLVADVAIISMDRYLVFFTTFWFALLIHHLKTGSKVSQYGLVITSLFLTYLDLAFLGLFWIPVVAILLGFMGRKSCLQLIRKVWGQHRSQLHKIPHYIDKEIADDGLRKGLHTAMSTVRFMLGMEISSASNSAKPTLLFSFVPGSLFRPLKAPPFLWFFRGRRWFHYLIQASIIATLASLMMVFVTKEHFTFLDWKLIFSHWDELITLWSQQWDYMVGNEYSRRFDVHLMGCMVIVWICALPRFYNPEDGFFEAVWLLIASLAVIGISSFLVDIVDIGQLQKLSVTDKSLYYELYKPQSAIKWLEVVLLTFGTIGVYHMIRALD